MHLTYKQPLVALCGAAIAREPTVDLAERDLGFDHGPVCPRCLEERAAGRYCQHGHVWRLDAMHGEPCQCRQLALLRDEDHDRFMIVTVREGADLP